MSVNRSLWQRCYDGKPLKKVREALEAGADPNSIRGDDEFPELVLKLQGWDGDSTCLMAAASRAKHNVYV